MEFKNLAKSLILPNDKTHELAKEMCFYIWDKLDNTEYSAYYFVILFKKLYKLVSKKIEKPTISLLKAY